jgi:SAM-dependent methyltransferase
MQIKINLRQEIILLIRGFFLTPVIATLAKENFFKKNINKNFTVKKKKLKIVITYLVNLGLVHEKKDKFCFSELGRELFVRSGSFNIVHSYRKYLFNLDKIIKNLEKSDEVNCDRKENVLGSGTTNLRKFFNPGLKLIKDVDFDIIHDLGCGDGNFLKSIKKTYKDKIITGSDLSKISIEETKKKIKDKNLKLIQADALNLDKWINWLKKIYDIKKQKVLISIWFIIHEISNKDVNKIVYFFRKIHKKIPNAKILLGEIVEPDKKLLDNNRYNSIMPEYMFFHQLSGQGIFNYDELNLILKQIPYRCKKKIEVDTIRYKNKENPSGIIWLLEPKN